MQNLQNYPNNSFHRNQASNRQNNPPDMPLDHLIIKYYKMARETDKMDDPEVMQLMNKLSKAKGKQKRKAICKNLDKIMKNAFDMIMILKQHDPDYIEPSVLEEYSTGLLLEGYTSRGAEIRECSHIEINKTKGTLGVTGMGKSQQQMNDFKQHLEEAERNPTQIVWAISRDDGWEAMTRYSQNLNTWNYHQSEQKYLETFFLMNLFDSPVKGMDRDWWALAVEAFCATVDATQAFRSNLMRMIKDPRRKEKSVPTFQKLIKWIEWVKITGDSHRVRNFLGYDDAVRDRIGMRMQYFLEEGRQMFRVERGIDFPKLVYSHNVWNLNGIGQDLYEFIVITLLMKLFFFKRTVIPSQKLNHVIFIDDAIKIVAI